MTPNGAITVAQNATQSFTVTEPDGGLTQADVGGSCPSGTWGGNVYTTGPIVADCTISFSTSTVQYQVGSSGDTFETITPSTAQPIAPGATASFVVDPVIGYTVSSTVGGSCPAGTWVNDVYTTGNIFSDCIVSFTATLNTYQVTPSGDGLELFTPDTPQTVDYGAAQSFTVTGNPDYTVSATVGGTCPTGFWSGTVYTSGPITADCSVSFSADPVCDPSCLTCSAPGPLACTSCAAGGTCGNGQPSTVYLVQGQSFTPSIAGNAGSGTLQADSSGNVQLASMTIDFQDPSTANTPASLYIYSTLPAYSASQVGAGAIGTGTNDGNGTGTYVFNPPLMLQYSSKYYALFTASYNIYDGPDAYAGGSDLFPDNPGVDDLMYEGSSDVQFIASFVGTALTAVDGGQACVSQ